MKSKKSSLSIFLIFVIVLFSGCVSQSSEPAVNIDNSAYLDYLKYDNPYYGIRLKYPKDWIKNENPTIGVVAFSSRNESYDENVIVFVGNLSASFKIQPRLEEYTNLSINNLAKYVPGFKLLELKQTTLSNSNANMYIYTSTYEGKVMVLSTIKNDKIYEVVYNTNKIERFNQNSDNVKLIIDSFEIYYTLG